MVKYIKLACEKVAGHDIYVVTTNHSLTLVAGVTQTFQLDGFKLENYCRPRVLYMSGKIYQIFNES